MNEITAGHGTAIIELCEDWWEILRQETVLFEVYVRRLFSHYCLENL